MSDSSPRVVEIDGTYNFRDIGGYRAGAQFTRWNTLYRSDALHRLTPNGVSAFQRLGIGTVIDLRDDFEREQAPNVLPAEVQSVASPIFQGVASTIRNPTVSIESFYRELVDSYATNYVSAIRHILHPSELPVLVHCTAGKDRTGTVIAFTLCSIGVDRDDVLHDYAQTEQLLAGEWADRQLSVMNSQGIELSPSLSRLLVASPSESLDELLSYIEQQHGSTAAYLQANGLTNTELEALANRLLTGETSP